MTDPVGDSNPFSADNQQRIKVAEKNDGLKHRYASDEVMGKLRDKVWFSTTYLCYVKRRMWHDSASLYYVKSRCVVGKRMAVLQVNYLPQLDECKKLTGAVRPYCPCSTHVHVPLAAQCASTCCTPES